MRGSNVASRSNDRNLTVNVVTPTKHTFVLSKSEKGAWTCINLANRLHFFYLFRVLGKALIIFLEVLSHLKNFSFSIEKQYTFLCYLHFRYFFSASINHRKSLENSFPNGPYYPGSSLTDIACRRAPSLNFFYFARVFDL